MPKTSETSRPVLMRVPLLAALAAVLAWACVPGGAEENAVRRGDEAFARDSLEEALAEYRLGVRQGGEEPELLARVAHTLVALGRVEEAADFYTRAAARADRWADIGVSDLVRLARGASERNDRFQMAAAMEAARRLRPGLSAPDLTLPLARHYYQSGEYGRALAFYQRALTEAGNPPAVLWETGRAHYEVGDCRSALTFFERFRALAPPRDVPEVDWSIGSCSFRLAQEVRRRQGAERADLEEALRYVTRTLEVGEPRSVQAQAWLERGEILSLLGDCDGALDAFGQVRYYETSNAAPAVVRAQLRIEQVRFGRGLVGIRGRCH
jgi:tetratricopeptide (TPR) repeat protein